MNKNDQTLMDELRSIADECPPRPLGKCLDEAKSVICGERQDTYGKPEDSFKIIAQYWSIYLKNRSNLCQDEGCPNYGYPHVCNPYELLPEDIAHMMILFKMARTQGQSPSRDNYVDLCGYAAIAADRFSD